MENAYELRIPDTRFQDFFLSFCGYAHCQPLHSFGPAVRPGYLLHFIMEGKGIYQVGERKYQLQAGQGFVIEPEVLTYYQADEKEPWAYIWIGFGGSRAGEYLSDIGLNSSQRTFQSGHGQELREIVLKMMKHNNMSVSNQYLLQGLLYEFFSVMAQDIRLGKEDAREAENIYISRAVHFIRNNYTREIKVTDIADYTCVTRSYLYKLFMKELGMSPQDCLTKFRIARAKELLSATRLPIGNVALSCGYQDSLVFSKAFKKESGKAPTVYREEKRPGFRRYVDSEKAGRYVESEEADRHEDAE